MDDAKRLLFVAVCWLGLGADQLWAQSGVDRRETNQPILLVDSESPTTTVFAMEFVPEGTDGLRLLAAGNDKSVWQWQIKQQPHTKMVTLELQPTIHWPINRGFGGRIATIASRPVGSEEASLVAFGGLGSIPSLVQLQNLKSDHNKTTFIPERLTQIQISVLSLAFWPEPSCWLAVGCGAKESKQAFILIWDVKHPDHPRDVLETGFDEVRFLSVSPDGRSVLAADGASLNVRRWNIRDLDAFRAEPLPDIAVPSPVVGFDWLGSERCLIATRRHGTVLMQNGSLAKLDPKTTRLVIRNRTGRRVTIAARSDGRNLATWEVPADRSQTVDSPFAPQIAVQDANGDWRGRDVNLQSMPSWDIDLDSDASGRVQMQAQVGMSLFSSAGEISVAVKRGFRLDRWPPQEFWKTIDLGNVQSDRPNFARLQESKFSGEITALAVSPNGEFVAAAGEQVRSTAGRFGEQPIQEIRLWRVSDGTLLAVTPDRGAVSKLKSPIRQVSLGRSQLKTSVPDVVQFGWSNNVRAALSLATAESGQAISSQIESAPQKSVASVAQSWKARHEAGQYWLTQPVTTPVEVGPFPQLEWIRSEPSVVHRFVRQSKEYLATGYSEFTLIWDLARVKQLAKGPARQREQAIARCFYRHTGQLSCLNTSDDGDYLITGAEDGSICLWSLAGIELPRDGRRELGLELKRESTTLRVKNVAPGSPAYFAGLREQDEVVKLRILRANPTEPDWIAAPDQMDSALTDLTASLAVIFEVRSRQSQLVAESVQEPLWTLFPMLDGQWVITTPTQVFGASSDEAMRRFGWHVNLGGLRDHQVAFFALDLFRQSYENLPYIGQAAWKNQTPVIRSSSFDIPTLVDIVDVRSGTAQGPSVTSSLSQPLDLDVTLRWQRTGSEVPKQLELWCNGRIIQQTNLKSDHSAATSLRWTIPKTALRTGERNLLTAIVRSDLIRDGDDPNKPPIKLINRAIRTITVAGSPRPRMHFVGIGVTALDHADQLQQSLAGFKPLRFAANDVCLLGQALAERGKASGFELGEFRYLVSQVPQGLDIAASQVKPPTHDEILKALDHLCEFVQPDDFVCVSVSCHGVASENNTYLIAQDTSSGFRNAVSDRELFEERLWKLNGSALVLLDACHSGSALTSDALRGLNGFGLGPEVLVSCKPRQESYEYERLHRSGNQWFGMSVFTAALLEAITGQELTGTSSTELQMSPVNDTPKIDRNADGFLSVEEWGLHSLQRVPVLQRISQRDGVAPGTPQQPDLLPSLAFPRSRIRLRLPSKP